MLPLIRMSIKETVQLLELSSHLPNFGPFRSCQRDKFVYIYSIPVLPLLDGVIVSALVRVPKVGKRVLCRLISYARQKRKGSLTDQLHPSRHVYTHPCLPDTKHCAASTQCNAIDVADASPSCHSNLRGTASRSNAQSRLRDEGHLDSAPDGTRRSSQRTAQGRDQSYRENELPLLDPCRRPGPRRG